MRLIVFDMDGTLVDSGVHITNTTMAAFAEHGLPLPTAEAARGIIGLSLEAALARLSGLAGPAVDRLATTYRRLYHQSIAHLDTEPLYSGITGVLDALKAEPGTLMAIATGKGMRGVERILKLHSLESHFVSKQTPDANPSKPDPGMLLSAMKQTGIGPEQTVMIGDSSFDMAMARAAGCFALGVSWGYQSSEVLRGTGAHAIVDAVPELIPAINALVIADA